MAKQASAEYWLEQIWNALTNFGNNNAGVLNVSIAATSGPLTAGEAHIGEVGGHVVEVNGAFARPNDTNPYVAGDVVSNSTAATTPVTLSSFTRTTFRGGYIVGARLVTDKKSITPRFRVHLFNGSNAAVAADNAQWKELYADLTKRIGYFDLPAMVTGADTTNSNMSRSIDNTIRIPFVAGASRDIFYVLETLDAFTPAANQNFTLMLYGDLD